MLARDSRRQRQQGRRKRQSDRKNNQTGSAQAAGKKRATAEPESPSHESPSSSSDLDIKEVQKPSRLLKSPSKPPNR
jgi:hypothetical protein